MPEMPDFDEILKMAQNAQAGFLGQGAEGREGLTFIHISTILEMSK